MPQVKEEREVREDGTLIIRRWGKSWFGGWKLLSEQVVKKEAERE